MAAKLTDPVFIDLDELENFCDNTCHDVTSKSMAIQELEAARAYMSLRDAAVRCRLDGSIQLATLFEQRAEHGMELMRRDEFLEAKQAMSDSTNDEDPFDDDELDIRMF